MDFFEVSETKNKDMVEKAIGTYGYAAEHNFYWYLACGGEYESSKPAPVKKEKNVFVRFKEGFGLLTKEDKGNVYTVFSEPLAPRDLRAAILKEYVLHAFEQKSAKKVMFELQSESREELLAVLPPEVRARRPSSAYTLISPVVNIETFDFSLSGKRNKLLRHTKNKFFRDHTVTIKDAKEVDRRDLCAIVDRWKQFRRAEGHAACERYYNIIGFGFKGAERAVAFIIDGRPVGFAAGWPIPNSTFYYLGVVLHDYSLPPVGVLLYVESLEWLRTTAYTHVDLGGGDKPITAFKNQFWPESWYTSYVFSTVRA